MTLRLKPEAYISDFILNKLRLPDCVVKVAERLDVLCGNRETTAMEQRIFTMYRRELVFQNAFQLYEDNYDAVIVDVATSILCSRRAQWSLPERSDTDFDRYLDVWGLEPLSSPLGALATMLGPDGHLHCFPRSSPAAID